MRVKIQSRVFRKDYRPGLCRDPSLSLRAKPYKVQNVAVPQVTVLRSVDSFPFISQFDRNRVDLECRLGPRLNKESIVVLEAEKSIGSRPIGEMCSNRALTINPLSETYKPLQRDNIQI